MAAYWLGEPFLYVCYAVLTGWLILIRAVPEIKIPTIAIYGSAIGIAIFAFLPILRRCPRMVMCSLFPSCSLCLL